MVSLGGLSAVYPGQLAAQNVSNHNDFQELQLKEAKGIQQGQADFAKGLMQALVPGAQAMPPQAPPQMAPQAPPPGQPSQPMRPPQPPPMAPPGPAAGGARGPQAGMQPGAPPAGAQPQGGPPGGGGLPPQAQQLAGRVDLRSAVQGILKANPGIQQDPQRLYYALKAGEWILNDQAKQQLADMRQQMQQQNLDLRRDNLDERERHDREIEDQRRDAEEAKQKRFDTREARLQAKQEIEQSWKVREQDLKQKYIENRIAAGDRKYSRDDAIAAAEAKRKAALAAASIYSVNNGMDDKRKAKLAQDVNDAADEEIARLKNIPGATSTGGTPKADGTKTSERAGDQPKPLSTDIRKQFDDALAAGKPKEALIKRLQEQGYTTEGL